MVIWLTYLAAAFRNPFVGRELFGADRTPGVEFAGVDAHFRPKPENAAVVKAGGAVYEYSRGVHIFFE